MAQHSGPGRRPHALAMNRAAMRRLLALSVTGAIILTLQSGVDGQRREVFKARLTAVPVDTVTVRTTTGSGSLTAVLEGSTLTLTGTFDGMNSPATVAQVRRA